MWSDHSTHTPLISFQAVASCWSVRDKQARLAEGCVSPALSGAVPVRFHFIYPPSFLPSGVRFSLRDWAQAAVAEETASFCFFGCFSHMLVFIEHHWNSSFMGFLWINLSFIFDIKQFITSVERDLWSVLRVVGSNIIPEVNINQNKGNYITSRFDPPLGRTRSRQKTLPIFPPSLLCTNLPYLIPRH